MKSARYEIIELAGRETRMFWVVDNGKNKIVGKWPTLEMAEAEVRRLES